MNAFNLTREGSTEVVATAFGKCGRVWELRNADLAAKCCDRRCACGAALDEKRGWASCDACRAQKEAEQEAACLAKAKRVPEAEYSGPVWLDGTGREGYHDDLDDFRDWWDAEYGEDKPLPEHVWACNVYPVQIPSADRILESACDDSYDGAYDDMPETGELQAAIDHYNQRVTARVYEFDASRIVLLAPAARSSVSGEKR